MNRTHAPRLPMSIHSRVPSLPLGLAAALALTTFTVRAAETLVDFNVANGTGNDSYQDGARPWSVEPSAQYARMNFDTQTPLFPANGQPPLYGGAVVTNAASGGTVAGWRFHDNNPAGWPSVPRVMLLTNSDGNYNNVLQAYVFKRADFAGAPAKVAFDGGSTLNVNVPDWYDSSWAGGAWPMRLRFLVRDNGQYYVSEAAQTTVAAFTLTDFDNNGSSGKRWAPVTLTATEFRIPAALSFQAVDFTDVSEVGWIGEGSSAYFRLWGFDTFQMVGTVVNDPVIALSTSELTMPEQGSNTFTVVLGAAPSGTVVLDVASRSVGEATVSPALLTFTGANWNTPQTVTLQGVDDTTLDVSDTTHVDVSVNASRTTATEYLPLALQSVQVTLVNDDFTFVVAYRGAEMLAASGIVPSVSVNPDAGAWPVADNTSPMVRLNFRETPLYTNATYSQARVCGGLEVLEGFLSREGSSFNSDAIYSGYAKSFCLNAGDTDAGAPCRMRGVLLWTKPNFASGLAGRPVTMGAGDCISLRLLDTFNHHDGTQQTDGIRLVIKNAGVYYYSQTRFRSTGGQLNPGTYRLDDVGAELWAPWSPTANPSVFTASNVLPGGGTFAVREFNDVEAVGIAFDGARAQWGSLFRFDEFLATGSDGTPLGMLILVR